MIIFSEPMTREGGLPAYRYIHSMKVNMVFIDAEYVCFLWCGLYGVQRK